MSSPYETLEPRAFWRTAVGEKNALEIDGLYNKAFEIAPTDRISTAGSCFAQHIGRNLAKGGYAYQDFEPAPTLLPPEDHQRFGYGMYSARYGNVYTARQLVQLAQRAVGEFEPKDRVWESGGRYYDPLRPTIEPDGFASRDEFDQIQAHHLSAVRALLSGTDVFVFTLGLTEAWLHAGDGLAYPICPGTAAGEFDASLHRFRNFSCEEIIADLRLFMDMARGLSPGMRFLLTVSPVPLTATAAGQHILAATTYSKSVLRAVAGALAGELEYVSYFPSYEIIASHPMRGMFFEPNMRSVSQAGVAHVMGMFNRAHPPGKAGKAPAAAKQEPERRLTREERIARRIMQRRLRKKPQDGAAVRDVWCDEELLDTGGTGNA